MTPVSAVQPMPCRCPLYSWRVIGIGNLLRGDDGIGCRVISELEKLDLPPDVDVVDGGSGGIGLISLFEGAEKFVLIDAVDMKQEPGTIIQLTKDQLLNGQGVAHALDLHSGDLVGLLQLADTLGLLKDVVLFGVQLEQVGYSGEMTPAVAAALPQLVRAICEIVGSSQFLA